MQATMQPTNYAVFIALLIIAALVGLLGAYLADGQVVSRDLAYCACEDTQEVWRTIGLAQFDVYYEFQPQATFRYSLEHVPTVQAPVDGIRYSVQATLVDVNAPPTTRES
ncbi:MAG: hypothetical protein JW759_10145 [Candidatus Coatesbacteria bacterium]|nr:hypothetical protein [Candidatus Coatesbacteria bacterium]